MEQNFTIIEPRVAILIPTRDRPEFIERTVHYYCDINSPHPIYIGDASSESLKHNISEWTKDSSLIVHYNNWPKLNASKTLTALAKAAKKDGEQFAAFHGDDDLFVPESLSKCANFLEQNSEYATAQGKAALVTLDRSGPYGHIERTGKYWEKKEIIGETPLERLDEMLDNYFVAQFSVHRLGEFLDACKTFEKIPCDRWGEIYQSLIFSMQGKSKHFNVFYLMRHVHPDRNMWGGKPRSTNILEWITTPTWYPSYQLVCEDLSIQLSDSGISLPEIQDRINEYLKKGLRIKLLSPRANFLYEIKNILKSHFPLLAFFKSWVGLQFKSTDDLSILINPKSKYYQEFSLISKGFAPNQNRAIPKD